jgi:hypothetical protein
MVCCDVNDLPRSFSNVLSHLDVAGDQGRRGERRSRARQGVLEAIVSLRQSGKRWRSSRFGNESRILRDAEAEPGGRGSGHAREGWYG